MQMHRAHGSKTEEEEASRTLDAVTLLQISRYITFLYLRHDLEVMQRLQALEQSYFIRLSLTLDQYSVS